MKMGDFMADIVNLFLLGYLFCLWDKRTEGKKLGIIILVWAGILCIPQQIHIINKSLFAQFVFVWILAEGKWFQKAVWFIQMQMIILGLDFLVIDLMVLGKKITNIKVSQLLITNMAVYIRFIIILVLFFLLRNRRKETGNIIKNLSYRMALYIFGTMVITLLTLGITQVYVLGNRSEKLVKAMPVFILLVEILQFVLCILVQKIVYDRKKLERISRMNEYCVEIQEKNYSEINRKNNDLRKFRHDYQEHIYVMQKLVKENHIEELKEYIESLGQKQESVSYIRTGNAIADAVVNQMYEMAVEPAAAAHRRRRPCHPDRAASSGGAGQEPLSPDRTGLAYLAGGGAAGPAAHPAAGSPAGAAVQSAGAGPHGVPGCVCGGAGGGVRLRRPPASGPHAAPEPLLSGSVPPDG